MLDVARHFFSVREVKRYIDLIALYKLNRLHLHLSDDQGWRIADRLLAAAGDARRQHRGRRRPGRLLHAGASTRTIVAYAASRLHHDRARDRHAGAHATPRWRRTPSWTATASRRRSTPASTSASARSASARTATYAFVDDVVGELAALTPGAVLPHRRRRGAGDHAGRLRARSSSACSRSSRAHGKRMIGWEEIGAGEARRRHRRAALERRAREDRARRRRGRAGREGDHVAGRPGLPRHEVRRRDAARAALGRLHRACATAYDVGSRRRVAGVAGDDVLGVEAPLWSETVADAARTSSTWPSRG